MPGITTSAKQRAKSKTEIEKALFTMLAERAGFKDIEAHESDTIRDVLNWAAGEPGTDFGKRLNGEVVAVDGRSDS